MNVSDKPCSFYFSALSISELTLSIVFLFVLTPKKTFLLYLPFFFLSKKFPNIKYICWGLGLESDWADLRNFGFVLLGSGQTFRRGRLVSALHLSLK